MQISIFINTFNNFKFFRMKKLILAVLVLCMAFASQDAIAQDQPTKKPRIILKDVDDIIRGKNKKPEKIMMEKPEVKATEM